MSQAGLESEYGSEGERDPSWVVVAAVSADFAAPVDECAGLLGSQCGAEPDLVGVRFGELRDCPVEDV